MASKKIIEDILAQADVKIGGNRPWDIQVHNERFYDRVLSEGTLGVGESYMDGWWDCEALDEMIFRVLRSGGEKLISKNLINAFHVVKSKIVNLQSSSRAFEVAVKHYDLDNDLYSRMIGPTMAYTCGYWKDVSTLDEAQIAKMDLVCKKMGLKPGMKVLDIGCGWGSFMKFAAEKYGVSCVGVTVSKEQIKLGEEFCKGLPIEFKFMDYRDISGSFDRVVSIGMFEAVGYKNFGTFMDVVSKCLKEDGLFLLHTVGDTLSKTVGNAWVTKYIFPNGMLPSIKQIAESVENIFVIEDLHNFGPSYDLTLMAWFKNFNDNWSYVKEKYDERFYRMWKYYLLSFAGSFRARDIQLWQIVLSPKGTLGGYSSVR